MVVVVVAGGEVVVVVLGILGSVVVAVVGAVGPDDPGGADGPDGVVADGPATPSLTAGANPARAVNKLGSFPSMPSAHTPMPPRLLASANWAASYSDVGSSKKVSCHWLPTWYEVHAVSVVASQYIGWPLAMTWP